MKVCCKTMKEDSARYSFILGHKAIVEKLYSIEGSIADRLGLTPMMWAAEKGYHEIVHFMSETQARCQDNRGWTALMRRRTEWL